METQQYQGDVSIIKLNKIPDNITFSPLKKDLIVAYGEATGHHHKIEVAERKDNLLFGKDIEGNVYLQVKDFPVNLTHQEHETQVITPGIYFIGKQYEYSEEEKLRQVID